MSAGNGCWAIRLPGSMRLSNRRFGMNCKDRKIEIDLANGEKVRIDAFVNEKALSRHRFV
jgi:hypothetical protein